MNIEFLYGVDLWIIFLVMLLVLFTAGMLFYQVGEHSHKHHPNKDDAINEILPTSIFGLLALLLGFSFSMSIARYDSRKTLSMMEANIIGTAYLRTEVLPENAGFQIRQLLKEYTEHRLHFFEHTLKGAKEYNQRTQNLQNQIWKLAAGVTRTDRGPLIANFIQSLNDLIDTSTQRSFASENHVPEVVHYVLFLMALIGLSLLSYVCGFRQQRKIPFIILSILFPVIITLILDLDRPGRGLIQVTQTNMSDLYDVIKHLE